MKKINRDEFYSELLLREHIQKIIKSIKIKDRIEENKLRAYVRSLIKEASVDDEVPHHSTGINVLEELLKKIIPTLEDGFKTLTTEKEQRDSFRAHIIHAVQNSLAPHRAQDDAGEEGGKLISIDEEESIETDLDADAEADIKVSVGDPTPEDPTKDDDFIDIDPPSGKSDRDAEEEEKINQFSIDDEDSTGRNVALQTYDKIESNIIDSYSVLENEEDENLFYDYLITNLKLYFDKFETELQPSLEEPTTPEYEEEKEKEEEDEEEGEIADEIEDALE